MAKVVAPTNTAEISATALIDWLKTFMIVSKIRVINDSTLSGPHRSPIRTQQSAFPPPAPRRDLTQTTDPYASDHPNSAWQSRLTSHAQSNDSSDSKLSDAHRNADHLHSVSF